MSKILSIVYQPEDQPYRDGRLADFIRVPVQSAELVVDHGIKGDRKAGGNPRRQLNLLSSSWLGSKKAEGFKGDPGQFGEQIILDQLDSKGRTLESLVEGQRLRLGANALIEITMPRTGCERLEAAQQASGLAGTHIGVMARVVEGGTIKVGDVVKLLE